MDNDKLDRTSSVPLYRQLRDLLRTFLREHPETARLPGEMELAAKYNVSRNTVRSAMKMLESAGIIQRVRKRGTLNSGKIDVWDPVRSNQSVGLVFPAGDALGKKAVETITQYCAGENITLKRYYYDWFDPFREQQTFLRAERENSAIIYYPHYQLENPELMQKLLQMEKPIVLFDIYNDSWEGNCVCTDHFLSGIQCAKFLHNTGCRKCVLTMPEQPIISNTLRAAGFMQYMQQQNIQVAAITVDKNFDNMLTTLKKTDCDGIFFPCPGNGLVEYLLLHPSCKPQLALSFCDNRNIASNGRKAFFIHQDEAALGWAAITCINEQMRFPGLGHRRILIAPKTVAM